MSDTSSDRKALKSGFWYILSNFVVKGAAFISTPIFTRLMTYEDIGAFENVTAWVHILMVITSLELMTSITFAKFEYKNRLDQFISSALALSTITTGMCFLAVILFKDFFMQLFGMDSLTINLVFLYCIFSPALQMIQVKNRVNFEYKTATILSVTSVFLSIALSLLLTIHMDNKYEGRLIGYYGSLILFNAILVVYIFSKGKEINARYWKFALSISIPMLIHGLSGQLLSSCDRIMIKKICGDSMTALYGIAYTAAMVISVLWSSLHSAWSPWAYEQMSQQTIVKLKKASVPYILLFFSVVFAFLLFAPELMLLMGGRRYAEAVGVIPPVVIGMFFQFVYSLYVNIEFFYKKQIYTAVGTTIAAVLNIFLNWLLLPKYGYVAAAYTTLIGYMALFAIHFFIVWTMKKTIWYSTKFNLGILIVSVLIIPISLFLYEHAVLRWSVIGTIAFILCCFLYKYRKELQEAVKKRSVKPIIGIVHF